MNREDKIEGKIFKTRKEEIQQTECSYQDDKF